MARITTRSILALIFTVLAAGSLQAQSLTDVLSGSDDEDSTTAKLVIADDIDIVANDEAFELLEEIEVEKGRLYDVAITQMKPNSELYVEFRKAGIKAGYRRYYSNEVGEFLFEYQVPNKRVGGTAIVRYASSDGTEHEHEIRVKVR
ncbi:MAG: hypothetical protein ACOCZ8_05415 [Bacteroidota bacterium]